jgi:hypothetical protein
MTVTPVPSSRSATRLSKASLRPLALREIEWLVRACGSARFGSTRGISIAGLRSSPKPRSRHVRGQRSLASSTVRPLLPTASSQPPQPKIARSHCGGYGQSTWRQLAEKGAILERQKKATVRPCSPPKGCFVNLQHPQISSLSEEDFAIEADLVAERLGLSTESFWREMGRGILYGVIERGEGEDAGRMRLTFRYRTRSWTVTLGAMVH